MFENDESIKGKQQQKGDEEMARVMDDIRIDISKSINSSFDDISKIQDGKLPKQSYKHMINRVKQKLNEEQR